MQNSNVFFECVSKICSPAVTELEVIVVDWLAKFLDLPKCFLNSSKGRGGGLLQGKQKQNKNNLTNLNYSFNLFK